MVNCKNCDNFVDNEPILVCDADLGNPFVQSPSHFEDGYKCTWNGIESLDIADLQKGNCRCRK